MQRLCASSRPGRAAPGAGGGRQDPARLPTRRPPTVEVAGRHLLAVIDQHTRVVLGQIGVDGKTSEITAFAPLLDTLTGIDLTGVVITADALHTQREHVDRPAPPAARTGC